MLHGFFLFQLFFLYIFHVSTIFKFLFPSDKFQSVFYLFNKAAGYKKYFPMSSESRNVRNEIFKSKFHWDSQTLDG